MINKNLASFIVFMLYMLSHAPVCAASYQISLAIFPMESAGDITSSDREEAENALYEVLIKSAKYNIVERSNITQVLNEHGFQLAGATDQKKTVEIGKILNVNKLINTRIYSKDRSKLSIKVSVIDVATARVEFSKDIAYANSKAKDLARFCATEIIMRYPLLGEVIGASGDIYIIDIGEDHGLKTGSRIFVARKKTMRDDKGQVLFEEFSRIGLLEVTHPVKSRSQAKLRLLESQDHIQKGDIVSPEPIPEKPQAISQTPLLPDVAKGKLLLDDNMEDKQHLSASQNKGDTYIDGALHLNATHRDLGHAFAFYPAQFNNLTNFIFEGEIEFRKTGKRYNGIDICFRLNGPYLDLNAYRLFINNDGKYEIRLGRFASRFHIVTYQPTPLLNRGNIKNKFRIVAYGSKFDIYINDGFLIGFEHELLEKGNIGFMVEFGGYAAVDNVKVWEAAKK